MTDQTFPRDANRVPISNLGLIASKAITFVAGTTGAIGATTLFTVTGTVAVRIFAVCSGSLTGATATTEVGVSGNTAALIAQTTATNITNGKVWVDTGPASVELLPSHAVVAANITQTIATAAVSGGTLTYYCVWNPISTDGNVVAA